MEVIPSRIEDIVKTTVIKPLKLIAPRNLISQPMKFEDKKQ